MIRTPLCMDGMRSDLRYVCISEWHPDRRDAQLLPDLGVEAGLATEDRKEECSSPLLTKGDKNGTHRNTRNRCFVKRGDRRLPTSMVPDLPETSPGFIGKIPRSFTRVLVGVRCQRAAVSARWEGQSRGHWRKAATAQAGRGSAPVQDVGRETKYGQCRRRMSGLPFERRCVGGGPQYSE